jgi:hypothetical protein
MTPAAKSSRLGFLRGSDLRGNHPARWITSGWKSTLQPLLSVAKLEAEGRSTVAQAKGISTPSRSNIQVVAAEAILVPKMTASLSGIGFKIIPELERQQSILLSTPTRWTWHVSSAESGLQTLSVRLPGQVKIDGNEIQRTFYEYTHDVEVSVGLLGLIQSYWQWITSTLLIPLVAWAWSQYRKRNTPPEQPGRSSLTEKLRKRKAGDA